MPAERILVVDDEPLIGLAFKRELSSKGYQVDSVLSGEEALTLVQKTKYDLALIDKDMPGIDGIETCRKIKKVSPETICVFMTGLFNKENILKEQQFVEAGGRTYYLYKPFSQGELASVVQTALREENK
ncbi:MAG: response regulator [Candidatus Omnitrophica bacterium]|nr:response regulator [Candidatus Omnitrophota bacterium]